MELSNDMLKQLAKNFNLDLIRKESIENLQEIDYITEPISYENFLQKYMVRNIPCLLSKWATAQWLSRLLWCKKKQIDWNLLNSQFGSSTVPITDCTEVTDYAQSKQSMKLSDFITYMEQTNVERCDVELPEPSSVKTKYNRLLYLKDWHFVRDYPEYPAYTTPPFFSSDWLNEYWDTRKDCADDYRFLYIGPAGSWTPFHADVFRSFSWSANICGRKKWIIYPAGHEESLRNTDGELPSDVSVLQTCQSNRTIKRFQVIQNAGDIIFVPSGWHHQVFNEEDTISINHNWFNGCNIDTCWDYIKTRLQDVRAVIADHEKTMENWHQHCQLMLKADCGIDYVEFYNCLHTIASSRIALLKSKLNTESNPNEKDDAVISPKNFYTVTNVNHAVFDLLQLYGIVKDVVSSVSFEDCLKTELQFNLNGSPGELLLNIIDILSSSDCGHFIPSAINSCNL